MDMENVNLPKRTMQNRNDLTVSSIILVVRPIGSEIFHLPRIQGTRRRIL